MEKLSLTDYFLIVAGIWFALLNIYLFKTIRSYKRLTQGSNGLNLEKILLKVAEQTELDDKRIIQLGKDITKLEGVNSYNFQKFALLRFNPFEDTGGDQSFALAILDGKNNGLVISSLHSRNNTRIYAKQVQEGKPSAHQLSKEEKEVLEKAVSHNRSKSN